MNPTIPPAYLALIESQRVSTKTQIALLQRAMPDDPLQPPVALTTPLLDVLRAMTARIVPQPPGPAIDLAHRIDAALAGGDGWRFADLPPDPEAYRAGLALLEAHAPEGFATLDPARQDALLTQLAAGTLEGDLDASQQRHWFEDVRAAAVQAYVSHPATMARIGYSGIAYGGDGPHKPGFHALDPGQREDWEPIAEAAP